MAFDEREVKLIADASQQFMKTVHDVLRAGLVILVVEPDGKRTHWYSNMPAGAAMHAVMNLAAKKPEGVKPS